MNSILPLTPTETDPDTHHWTPSVQRAFLEGLAQEGTVRAASLIAHKSWRSAYSLRMQRRGYAFRLGWDAALLIARARLADELMTRAFDGQEDVVIREGDTVTRHRQDNRLGLSLLARLDSFANSHIWQGPAAEQAQMIAQDFELFLDLVGDGGDAGAVRAFLAERQVIKAAETGAPGQRELFASPVAAANDDEVEDAENQKEMRVWLEPSHDGGYWMTNFPPPEDFCEFEIGRFGDPDYERRLTSEEEERQDALDNERIAKLEAQFRGPRDTYFRPIDPETSQEANE